FPPTAGVFLPAPALFFPVDGAVFGGVVVTRRRLAGDSAALLCLDPCRGATFRGLHTRYGALGRGAIAPARPLVALLHIATTTRPIRCLVPSPGARRPRRGVIAGLRIDTAAWPGGIATARVGTRIGVVSGIAAAAAVRGRDLPGHHPATGIGVVGRGPAARRIGP